MNGRIRFEKKIREWAVRARGKELEWDGFTFSWALKAKKEKRRFANELCGTGQVRWGRRANGAFCSLDHLGEGGEPRGKLDRRSYSSVGAGGGGGRCCARCPMFWRKGKEGKRGKGDRNVGRAVLAEGEDGERVRKFVEQNVAEGTVLSAICFFYRRPEIKREKDAGAQSRTKTIEDSFKGVTSACSNERLNDARGKGACCSISFSRTRKKEGREPCFGNRLPLYCGGKKTGARGSTVAHLLRLKKKGSEQRAECGYH